MIRGDILHRHSGDEDLITPEHRQSAESALGVAACLLDDGLQDGDTGRGTGAQCDGGGQLDAGLVIVLCTGQGSQPGALASSVKQTNADLACKQIGADIASNSGGSQLAGFLEGIQCPQCCTSLKILLQKDTIHAHEIPTISSSSGPVFVDRQHHGLPRQQGPATRIQSILPVGGLQLAGAAHNHDVEPFQRVHDGDVASHHLILGAACSHDTRHCLH
jgi:hypothetical protein